MSTIEDSAQTGVPYVPDRVEVVGRRLKMEYVGMGSVFVVIALVIFGNLTEWSQIAAGTAFSFFLFLGLKKKTRDHLVTSLLMFAAAAMAREAVALAHWALPLMAFGALVWALEGYMEKRQSRIWVLPFAFIPWVMVDPSWVLGLVYLVVYLAHPWTERPGLRRKLAIVVGAAIVLAAVTFAIRGDPDSFRGVTRLPLDTFTIVLLLVVGLPALYGLVAYWSNLALPRKWNAVIFGLLAPWDLRLAAIFAVPATVVLAATLFQQSIDSDRLRPILKHAEWYFFWVVLAVAIWAGVERFA